MVRKRSWWGWCRLSDGSLIDDVRELSGRLLSCRRGGQRSSLSVEFELCRGYFWLRGASSSVGGICEVSGFGCGSSSVLLLLRLNWLLNRLGRLRSSSGRSAAGNSSLGRDFFALVWKTR
jgi:hypothetical protein